MECKQQRGGVLYITDPPPNLDFGIDCMNYETGAKFRGVCMIPEGIHFIYHSTGMGSRQGFFLLFHKDEILVKSWDMKNEDISAQLLIPEESLEALVYSINCGKEDQFLGPYPLQEHASWINLSNFLTISSLRRAGLDFHTPIYPGDTEDIPEQLLSERNHQAVTSFFPHQPRVAQFCDTKLLEKDMTKSILNSHELDSAARTAELSKFYLDKSSFLENVVSQYFDGCWEEVLAEVQLSFVLFMLLFSYPALQQWKTLVHLICKSERVLLSQHNFASSFIRVFFEQLRYLPDDFFEAEISTDNFLKPVLTELFESLDSQKLPESLEAMRKRMFVFVQKKFNLYVSDSPFSDIGADKMVMSEKSKFNLMEEDMPVVVLPDDMDSFLMNTNKDNIDNSADSIEQTHDHELAEKVKNEWNHIDKILGINIPQQQDEAEIHAFDRNEMENRGQHFSSTDGVANGTDATSVMERSVESSLLLQDKMFCWRYPLLYDEMTRFNLCCHSAQSGQEDLTMTAMRVIETLPSSGCDLKAEQQLLRSEAVRFVQDETSLWS